MKTFATICALSLSIAGCALDRTHQDTFASLHGVVKHTLADSCDCGPIATNEVGGEQYFEVKPQPRGLLITISKRQYFSPPEWERRYDSGMNLMSQFMELARTNHSIGTNHPIDAQTAERFEGFTNLFGLSDLPEWHYRDIGVDVRVQEVDEVYPGSDQDSAEAEEHYRRIAGLLKPYRANPQGGANGRQLFSSDTNRTSAAAASRRSP